MALADRLKEDPRLPTGIPCSVGALLDQLGDTSEGKALREMMYVLGWSEAKIEKTLAAEGLTVGKQMTNRHRSQSCRCWK